MPPRLRLYVENDNRALIPHGLRDLCNQSGIGDRCGADRNLFDTEPDDRLGLLRGLYATAIAQRHARLGREILDHAVVGFVAANGGVDVKYHQFVDLLFVEDLHGIDRIADVLRLRKADCLDQPSVVHQQAGNDSGSQHDLYLREILKQSGAVLVTLLGMELNAEDVARVHGADECGCRNPSRASTYSRRAQ